MNKTKKIVSLLLALVMVFAMTATAFAAEGSVANENNTATTNGDKTLGENDQFQEPDTPKGDTASNNNTSKDCSITVEDTQAGHEYHAYQIFKGDLSVDDHKEDPVNKTLSNIQWGEGVHSDRVAAAIDATVAAENLGAVTFNKADAAKVADWLSGQSSAVAAVFAKELLKNSCLRGDFTLEPIEGGYQAKDMAPGYYLIVDKDINAENLKDDVYSANMLQVLGTETMKPKSGKPTLDKKIVEGDKKTDHTTSDVGKVVNFEVDSIVPNMTDYDSYKYIIHDTMTSGLTFYVTDTEGNLIEDPDNVRDADRLKAAVSIKMGDDTISADKYTVTWDKATGKLDINFTGIYELVGKNNEGSDGKYKPGTSIVVTYSALVNKNALGTNVEINKAELDYSNNPNKEDEFTTTPDSKVYVYDFTLDVNKYDGSDETKTATLAGASFVLKNEAGQYYKWNEQSGKVDWTTITKGEDGKEDLTSVKLTTDENGKLDPNAFQGLAAGKYSLIETDAPSKFNRIETPIEIEIKEVELTPEGETEAKKYYQVLVDGEEGTKWAQATEQANRTQTQLSYAVDVPNLSGAVLPETGGIGTTIFYIVGGVLAAGAVILLITKRRMNIDE